MILPYTSIDRIGVNRKARYDNYEVGEFGNQGVMETYLDYAAFRGNMEIFKHIYYLSNQCRRPRKVHKTSKNLRLLKNSRGRTPDFFAKGAFKQKILRFMEKNP